MDSSLGEIATREHPSHRTFLGNVFTRRRGRRPGAGSRSDSSKRQAASLRKRANQSDAHSY
eukprot:7537776-Pyramimonas_sp.AAC.1